MITWVKVKAGVYKSGCGHYEVSKTYSRSGWICWDKRAHIHAYAKTATEGKGWMEGRALSRAQRFAVANATLRQLILPS